MSENNENIDILLGKTLEDFDVRSLVSIIKELFELYKKPVFVYDIENDYYLYRNKQFQSLTQTDESIDLNYTLTNFANSISSMDRARYTNINVFDKHFDKDSVVHSSVSFVYFNINNYPFHFEENRIYFKSRGKKQSVLFAVLTDLSVQKRIEKKLIDIEKSSQAFMQMTDDAVFEMDLFANSVLFRGNWMRLLGFMPQFLEFDKNNLSKLINPSDAKSFNYELSKLIRGEVAYSTSTINFVGIGGDLINCLIRMMSVQWDSKGFAEKIVGLVHKNLSQISEIINSEFHDLPYEFCDSSSYAELITDDDDNIVLWNKKLEQISGVQSRYAIGKNYFNMLNLLSGIEETFDDEFQQPLPKISDLLANSSSYQNLAPLKILSPQSSYIYTRQLVSKYQTEEILFYRIQFKDVSDEVEFREEILANEGFLNELLELSNTLIYKIDLINLRILFFNNIFRQTIHPNGHLTHNKTYDVFCTALHPNDKLLFENISQQLTSENAKLPKSLQLRYKIKNQSGDYDEFLDSLNISKTNNSIIGFGFARNVTELAKCNDILKFSIDKTNFLLEQIRDFLLIMTSDGNISYASNTFLDIISDIQDSVSFYPMQRPSEKFKFDKLSKSPYLVHYEQNINSKHGQLWIDWSMKGITDENGEIIEIVAVGRDITQLKRSSEVVKTQRDMAEMIFNSARAFVVVVNNALLISSINAFSLEQTGYDDYYFIERSFIEVFNIPRYNLSKLSTENIPKHLKSNFVCANGEMISISWQIIQLVEMDTNRGWLFIGNQTE